ARPREAIALRAIGNFAKVQLPPNAVLLLDEREKLERNTLMFWADRTSYSLPNNWPDAEAMIAEIRTRGGKPYLISHRPLPVHLPNIFSVTVPSATGEPDARRVWAWKPADA